MGILFVSGTPIYACGRNDLENFRQLPSDRVDFLEKPLQPSAFLGKVDEMIRSPGRRSAGWPNRSFPPRDRTEGPKDPVGEGSGVPCDQKSVEEVRPDDAPKGISVVGAAPHESAELGHLLRTAF